MLTKSVIALIITETVIRDTMQNNFNKIPLEKQKTVINAGFLCFGQNGYAKTSMADIAKAAGVSKASLFQYFGTKKNMYLFLYEFAGKEVARRISKGSDDYFECAKLYLSGLSRLSVDYPNLFDFIVLQAQRKDFGEIEELFDVANEVCAFNDTLYADVDWGKFKAGFNKEIVQNLFNWLSSGCISQYSQVMDPQQVYQKMISYLDLLKMAMYKPEFV